MKKVYHLGKCNTCQQILAKLNWNGMQQDIRSKKITSEQIDEMARLAGSYEALFSRRAMKYKSMELKGRTLSEQNYRQLILEEDTFLKRPVFLINQKIFIGNTKKIIEAVQIALDE